MANPGPYPPMGGPPMGGPMQPMGGPPPMGGPMGGPPPMGGRPGMVPRPPIRQGTSRMVPVVVSAGLAIGVFCGLLFGLGTKRDAIAEPPKASNGVKRTEDAIDPGSLGTSTSAPSGKPSPVAGSNAVANAGSAGTGSTPSTERVAPPAAETTKLIIEVKPDAAAQIAKLYIDGKEMSEMMTDIELPAGTTKKKVVVAIKAPGYKDAEQVVEVEGESTTLKLELAKAPRATVDSATPAPSTSATPSPPPPANTGTKPSGTRPSGSKPSGKKTGNGGLIDI